VDEVWAGAAASRCGVWIDWPGKFHDCCAATWLDREIFGKRGGGQGVRSRGSSRADILWTPLPALGT
jgi:hypothetical protein